MSDYIYRDDAKKALCKFCSERNGNDCEMKCAEYNELCNIPTVDIIPVVHGHWEWTGIETAYCCSVCKQNPVCGTLSNYCPNCGTKMDEVEG